MLLRQGCHSLASDLDDLGNLGDLGNLSDLGDLGDLGDLELDLVVGAPGRLFKGLRHRGPPRGSHPPYGTTFVAVVVVVVIVVVVVFVVVVVVVVVIVFYPFCRPPSPPTSAV